MKTFKEYLTEQSLTEAYINLSSEEEKERYAEQVFDILQKSYAKIGGIHGSGFSSPEEMVKRIPWWKLFKRDGRIIACVLYKNTNGRKLVAMGSDGSPEGKEIAKRMLRDDIESGRAYGEVSDAVLKYLRRTYGDELEKYFVPSHSVADILHKEIEPTSKHTYKRKIGDTSHEKAMYGKTGQSFKK